MIIRSLLRAQAPKTAGRRTFRIPPRTFRTTRRYSTSSAEMASPVPQSQASMLATITTDLDKIAPRFEIQPDQIEILQTPAEFYQTLKVGRSLLLSFSYSLFCSVSLLECSTLTRQHSSHVSISVLLYYLSFCQEPHYSPMPIYFCPCTVSANFMSTLHPQ